MPCQHSAGWGLIAQWKKVRLGALEEPVVPATTGSLEVIQFPLESLLDPTGNPSIPHSTKEDLLLSVWEHYLNLYQEKKWRFYT